MSQGWAPRIPAPSPFRSCVAPRTAFAPRGALRFTRPARTPSCALDQRHAVRWPRTPSVVSRTCMHGPQAESIARDLGCVRCARAPFRRLPAAACVSRSTTSFGLGPPAAVFTCDVEIKMHQTDFCHLITQQRAPVLRGFPRAPPGSRRTASRGNERFTTPESLRQVVLVTSRGVFFPWHSNMTCL